VDCQTFSESEITVEGLAKFDFLNNRCELVTPNRLSDLYVDNLFTTDICLDFPNVLAT
jgi:hypothetical protein